jgi:hypothetical protein
MVVMGIDIAFVGEVCASLFFFLNLGCAMAGYIILFGYAVAFWILFS